MVARRRLNASSRATPQVRPSRRGRRRKARPPWRSLAIITLVVGALMPAALWASRDKPATSSPIYPSSAPINAPSAPLDARVEETAATMLRLTWRPVANTLYYQVQLNRGNGALTTILQSPTSQVEVGDLEANSNYGLSVRAILASGGTRTMTPFSAPIIAKTDGKDKPELLIPRSFKASTPGAGKIRTGWEEISGVDSYEMQYSPTKDFTNAKILRSAKPSATIDQLDGGVKLHLRVRATGSPGEGSAWTTPAAATSKIPSGPTPVRVATYNIRCHSCGGASWSSRRIPIASLITDQNPDVVGVQEAQQSNPRGFGVSQFTDLVRALAQTGAEYVVTEPAIGASKGERIIYKPSALKLLNKGVIRYSSQGGSATPRYAVWAIFRQRSTGREMAFFSTHLEPRSSSVRYAQSRQLAASIAGIADGRPVVALGDFNASQFRNYRIHQAMTGAGLVDPLGVQASSKVPAPDAPVEKRIRTNYDSFNDARRVASRGTPDPQGNGVYIDYIFTSPMRVLEFEHVLRLDGAGRFAGVIPSDHNMLRADVVLPD